MARRDWRFKQQTQTKFSFERKEKETRKGEAFRRTTFYLALSFFLFTILTNLTDWSPKCIAKGPDEEYAAFEVIKLEKRKRGEDGNVFLSYFRSPRATSSRRIWRTIRTTCPF